MSLKVEIPDNHLTYFSIDARDELQKQMEKYALEIITETGRLEETIRDDEKSTPEITRTLVKKSIPKYNDFFPNNKKTSKKVIGYKIASTLSIFISGVIFDYNKLTTNPFLLGIFLFIAAIAICTTTLMFVSEGKNE